jgi:hypothetical protein
MAVSRNSPYASTAKQWGFFKSLTGHELPRGISKAQASKLIEQAKAGTWAPPVREIRVGRHQFYFGNTHRDADANGYVSGGWRVWIAYRIEGPAFDTQDAALAWAQAQARAGETVELSTSIHTQMADD